MLNMSFIMILVIYIYFNSNSKSKAILLSENNYVALNASRGSVHNNFE